MDEIRAFVAVNLDLRTTRRVADVQKRVHEVLGPRGKQLRWVPPANLHVTMKFLGGIDPTLVAAIRDALRPVAQGRRVFRVRARGLGAFPDVASPKVVWIGLEDDGALEALATDVDARLNGIGFPKEKRRFHPHVTLARVKEPSGLALGQALEQMGAIDCGDSPIAELVVYRSEIRPTGSEYEALERLGLASRAQG